MKPFHAIVSTVAATLMALGTTPSRAELVISDAMFNPSDWSATVYSVSGTASHTDEQSLTGGNPGAYRRMSHILSSSGNIGVAHLFLADSFDPSTAGAIVSLDYRENRIEFNPPFTGAAIGASPVLRQDDVFYFGPSITFTNLSWDAVQLTGLTATDFTSISLEHPDFSTSGGLIHFGYARSNTSNSVVGVTTQHGIDNWSYTVHAIPEPGSFMITIVGALGALGFRHRRRSKNPVTNLSRRMGKGVRHL